MAYVHQSRKEEIANAITHGVGAVLVLVANPILIINSYLHAGPLAVLGITIYSISVFLMFLFSCLYHAMFHNSPHKQIFHLLDHIFIYVAIAGTYTPIALTVIGGWEGYVILGVQWGAVSIGTLYKVIKTKKNPRASLFMYLSMGWIAILFMYSLITKAHIGLILLILLGGLFYSLGSYYYRRRVKYSHMIWHLLVIAGAIAHYLALCLFLTK